MFYERCFMIFLINICGYYVCNCLYGQRLIEALKWVENFCHLFRSKHFTHLFSYTVEIKVLILQICSILRIEAVIFIYQIKELTSPFLL